jgi:prepilin-type N-terminal cleavage/methylation domain-containing protein
MRDFFHPSVHPARRGLTLVELLVVIAVIGVLVALLLPAVLAARSAARTATCLQHLRQIGLGLQAYHAPWKSFPPGGIEWRTGDDTKRRQLAWSAFLLPFVEQQALYETLDLSQAFDAPANAAGAATVLEVYLCPSAEREGPRVEGRGACDYGGIFGERISGPNQPPKGTMLYDRAIRLEHIKDGASRTLIVAEDSAWPDGQWINGRNLFDQAFPINKAPPFENDIRSHHAGGAQAVLADGSARFLSEAVDLRVLAALCTRAGGESTGDFE